MELTGFNVALGLLAILGSASLLIRTTIDTFVVLVGVFDWKWLKEKLQGMVNYNSDVMWIALFCLISYLWLTYNVKPHVDLMYVAALYLYVIGFYWLRAKLLAKLKIT